MNVNDDIGAVNGQVDVLNSLDATFVEHCLTSKLARNPSASPQESNKAMILGGTFPLA